jgi:hypothetical protein
MLRQFAVPRHGFGNLEDNGQGVEYGPMPMIFQDAPTALARIVRAVIRRIVRQADGG